MIYKIVNLVLFYFLVNKSLVWADETKSFISVHTVELNDIKDHSFLRLVTPSGTIYHFTDDKGIVQEPVNQDVDLTELPFLTVVGSYPTEHYICFDTNETEYKVVRRQSKEVSNLLHSVVLNSFTGVDKKLYNADLGPFFGRITKAPMLDNGPVDYLEFRILNDQHDLVYTFTEDGSDLVDIFNCTHIEFLQRTPNYLHSSSNGSLPYISFVHIDSHWYDIFFPTTETDFHPFLMRNKSKPRNKCGRGIDLKMFSGPDNNHYALRYDWVLDEEGKYHLTAGHSFFGGDVVVLNAEHKTEIYRFSDDNKLELLEKFGLPPPPPLTPGDIQSIHFKCLRVCGESYLQFK